MPGPVESPITKFETGGEVTLVVLNSESGECQFS